MIEINLVPDVKQELIRAQRIRSMVITIAILIGSISVAVVVILAMYVFTIQTVRNNLADGDIKKLSGKLAEVKDLSKTLTIQNQLTKMSALNSDKSITSRTFALLTAINPPSPNNITISNLNIDTSSKLVTIEGQAPNSYAALEVFKKTIESAKVKYTDSNKDKQEVNLASSISLTNTSWGEDSSGIKTLRFTISFVYAPELFSLASKEVSIATATGNFTDSYLGIPDIFADRPADFKEEQ